MLGNLQIERYMGKQDIFSVVVPVLGELIIFHPFFESCQGGVQLKPAKARELLLGSGGNPEKLEVFSGGFMAGKKPVTLGNSLKFDPSRGFFKHMSILI